MIEILPLYSLQMCPRAMLPTAGAIGEIPRDFLQSPGDAIVGVLPAATRVDRCMDSEVKSAEAGAITGSTPPLRRAGSPGE